MNPTYIADYMDNDRFSKELTTPVYNKLHDHLAQIKRNEIVSPVQYVMKSMEKNEKLKNDHGK